MKFLKPLLVLAFVAIFACNSTSQNSLVDADKFEKLLKENTDAILLDVRTPEEYAGGYIAGAKNLNFNDGAFSKAVPTLDKTKPVFVYCLAGGRSAAAANELKSAGFTRVYDLKNGFRAWKNANKAITGAAPAVAAASPAKLATDQPTNLTNKQFLAMLDGKKYSVVDFNAKWCGPCKKMSPILDAIQKEQGDKVNIVKIDSDLNPSLSNEYDVEGLPTLLFFAGTKLIGKSVGFASEAQLRAVIAEYADKVK